MHSVLGPGYLESTDEEALAVELGLRSIPFVRQAPLSISYKRKVVGQQRIDLLVDGDLVVELKAVESFLPIHVAQVMSYLKAGAFDLALLINFNVPRLKDGIRRVFWFP